MLPRELMPSIGKKVYLNQDGRRAFSDSEGTFYLLGFRAHADEKHNMIWQGFIGRHMNDKKDRSVAIEYLERA